MRDQRSVSRQLSVRLHLRPRDALVKWRSNTIRRMSCSNWKKAEGKLRDSSTDEEPRQCEAAYRSLICRPSSEFKTRRLGVLSWLSQELDGLVTQERWAAIVFVIREVERIHCKALLVREDQKICLLQCLAGGRDAG